MTRVTTHTNYISANVVLRSKDEQVIRHHITPLAVNVREQIALVTSATRIIYIAS